MDACSMSMSKRFPLWQQIILGTIIGVIVGIYFKEWGIEAKWFGDIFIKLIQMTIVPIVFPLIVLGIARIHSGKGVGRMALKALIYFEVVTTILILMSWGLVHLLGSGEGANLAGADAGHLSQYVGKAITFKAFVLSVIPANVLDAMSQGNLLPVLFFGIVFGIALGGIGEKAKPMLDFLESLSDAMFKIIAWFIALSPFGIFGFVAHSIAVHGFEKVLVLIDLVLIVYIGVAIVLLVIFPLIAWKFHIPYFKVLKNIKDLILIVATTNSSEAALAPAIERLESMGVKNSAVSFVLPFGYSFNLDGGSVYWVPAMLFVANAFNIDLTIMQQVQMVITLMAVSKGIAGVAGSNFVVMTSVATMFGLPLEGVALVFAVDWLTGIARTATNFIGNILATCVIAKSEHLVDLDRNWNCEPQTQPLA